MKIAGFVVGVIFTWSAGARANDPLAAEAAFAEARTLMERGNYVAACPKLERSYNLDPALGTVMNLGECFRRQGRLASAWLRYREAAAMALAFGQSERESIARERAKSIESHLCRVVLRRASPSEDISVSRDDLPSSRDVFDVAIPTDSGDHIFVFTEPNHLSRTLTVHVPESPDDGPCADTSVLILPLPEMRNVETGTITRTIWRPSHITAISFAAASLVGFALAAGFGVDAIVTKNNADSQCGVRSCSAQGSTWLHEAGRSADLATVFVSVGIGLLAVGVVTWIASPSLRVSSKAPLAFQF